MIQLSDFLTISDTDIVPRKDWRSAHDPKAIIQFVKWEDFAKDRLAQGKPFISLKDYIEIQELKTEN